MPKAREAGLLRDDVYEKFQYKISKTEEIRELLRHRKVTSELIKSLDAGNAAVLQKHTGRTFEQAIKDPEISIDFFKKSDEVLNASRTDWLTLVELDIKYGGYIEKQEKQVKRFERMEKMKIPDNFSYDTVDGISNESRQKFKAVLPSTIGQASRISGVRTSDIAVLMIYLGRKK
jgi:tRNA uridine 5-carboxymethylaminomethyl modification enzyme